MDLESGLFYQLRKGVGVNPHFKELEISWVGDFNVKMRALQESMGAIPGKRHVTYRYLFVDQGDNRREGHCDRQRHQICGSKYGSG